MTRCGFCGKSPDDVRVIFVRGESAIFDECVLLAFDAIGAEKGRVYQRVAYSVFRVVATVGRFLTLSRREGRQREDVETRTQLELRRAAYGSAVLSSVRATVLAHRLGLSHSDLQPILDDLVVRGLISPGLSPDSYRSRDWNLNPPSVDPGRPEK